MNKEDKIIAKYIILAQTASDGGKGMKSLNRLFPTSNLACYKGYQAKDGYIKKAIMGILKSKNSIFRFYCKQDKWVANYIVYFNFKLEGERYQVSFHSFKDWSHFENSNCGTRWDKRDSREACLRLFEEMKEEF